MNTNAKEIRLHKEQFYIELGVGRIAPYLDLLDDNDADVMVDDLQQNKRIKTTQTRTALHSF
jgi:hypothetical protein